MARLVAAALMLLGVIAAMLAVGGLPWGARKAPAGIGATAQSQPAPAPPLATWPTATGATATGAEGPQPAPVARIALPASDDPAAELTRAALRSLQRAAGPSDDDLRAQTEAAVASLRPSPASRLRGLVRQSPVVADPYLSALRAEALGQAPVIADRLYGPTLDRLRQVSAPEQPSPPAQIAPYADLVRLRPAPRLRTHLVRPGETLTTIAETVFGRASAWVEIMEANRDRLASPDLVRAGMVLRLPDLPRP